MSTNKSGLIIPFFPILPIDGEYQACYYIYINYLNYC